MEETKFSNVIHGADETRTRDLLRDRQAFYPSELSHQTILANLQDEFERCVRDSNS